MTALQTVYEGLISPAERCTQEGGALWSVPSELREASRSLFHRVVVPLALATDPAPLLRLAAELAARFHAEILLLRLAPAGGTACGPAEAARLKDALSENAQRLIRAGAARVHVELFEGNAGRHLEEIARRRDATLILLSEERDDSHPSHWFGTVLQRLERAGHASLLVAKPSWVQALTPLLCVVDFTDSSRAALAHALELARALACRLTVLHVVPVPVTLREEAPIWRRDRAPLPCVLPAWHPVSCVQAVEVERKMVEAKRDLQSFAGGLDLSGVKCEMLVACGSLVAETISAARARKAGLIVIGSAPRRGLTAAEFQSPAATIAEIGEIPVWISQSASRSVAVRPQVFLPGRKTQ